MEASASRSRLFCAISQGDVAEVKALLSASPTLASAKIRSKTPLHAVCLADYLPNATCVALINLLVSNGADVNQKTQDRMTPLFYACRFGQTVTIKTLIAHGAPWDISGVRFTWNSPMHEAIDAGQLDVLKLRHSMQPFREWVNPNVESAVKLAISNRNIEIVRYFLDTDPTLDVNNMSSGERDGNSTPLTLAIEHGAEDIVDLLLTRNADVNKSSAYGHSPLSCAAREGLVSVVQHLLHEGADPTHFHPESEPSPMKGAVLARSLPIMKLLLDHGAKVDVVDTFDLIKFHGTPLDVAVMENLYEEAEFLVKEGHADVNFTWGNNKTSVICHAAGRGNVEMMALLLDHGADVSGGDADYSPLYYAVSSGHLAATQWLVEHGAEVEGLMSNANLFKYCVVEAERLGRMAAVDYLKALKTKSQTEAMDTSMDEQE